MTNAELLAKIKAEIERISSRAMNEEGQDLCEYLLSFISSIEEKSEKLSAERDKDMIESIEMWLHEIEPKWVEKELAWLDELRTRLLEEEPEKPVNPEDAMKELDEKIALVKQRGTWDGVDVDKYMDEMRGREPEKPMNQDEELNEEIKRFAAEYDYERSEDILLIAIVARHFAQWGAEHAKIDVTDFCKPIDPGIAQCIADHSWEMLGEDEKPVPNGLEEAANEYANKHYSEWDESWDDYNGHNIEPENDKLQLMDAFIAGAKWMSIHGNDIKEL